MRSNAVAVLMGHALRENVRRRVFLVVGVLTLAFLLLYALGIWQAYRQVTQPLDRGPVNGDELLGASLFGLGTFAILFLGTVLAVFVTLGAVRGEAEAGMLQQIVVRPVGRAQLLLARWLAAVLTCAAYVTVVYFMALVTVRGFGGWWPDSVVTPLLGLIAAIAIIAGLSLLGSVLFSSIANGIATFMVFGAGLFAGLLAEVGHLTGNPTVSHIARGATFVLPFEALYQNGLAALTQNQHGLTAVIVNLGPLGGGRTAGPLLLGWTAVYAVLVGLAAGWLFARRDL